MYLGKSMRGVNLSAIQREIITRGSQIYKHETLVKLHGSEKAQEIHDQTTRSLLLLLGKGSGKDFVSRVTCAYVVHKLLCLKDPSQYYGKPTGDSIDIVNMALNSDQAFRVFFDPLKKVLKRSPWFSERIKTEHTKDIEFEKDIFIYSLHSSWEAAEGLNIIVAVLDEIDGFTTEGYSDAMYHALDATVTSRFPKYGKVLCLSFPRSKGGWMMRQYDKVVHEKVVETFEHVYRLNQNLPEGTEGNEFTVHWDEDTIVSYKLDNWFALKAPTFRVNPITNIDDYRDSFLSDLESNTAETLLRVCANPPDHVESIFLKNQDLVQEAFDQPNGWDDEKETIVIRGDDEKEYFIHVDLSKVSDRTVVAMAHVDHWQQIQIGGSLDADVKPSIIVDLFRVWEPNRNKHINNADVVNFIMELAKRFNVIKVTFDRWGSIDLIDYLNERSIDAERQSLARPEYEEWKYAIQDQRIKGPYDKRFLKEMKHLIITKTGKVDHPDGKEHYNDISEAVCGATNGCVKNAMEELEVQIVSKDTVRTEAFDMLQRDSNRARVDLERQEPDHDLAQFLAGIEFL